MKVKDQKGREGKWGYQEIQSDGDDDGGGDGNGGEVEVTEVAGEGLGYDSHVENMASLLKMEGPAIAHNFFDSNHVCLSKLLALFFFLVLF